MTHPSQSPNEQAVEAMARAMFAVWYDDKGDAPEKSFNANPGPWLKSASAAFEAALPYLTARAAAASLHRQALAAALLDILEPMTAYAYRAAWSGSGNADVAARDREVWGRVSAVLRKFAVPPEAPAGAVLPPIPPAMLTAETAAIENIDAFVAAIARAHQPPYRPRESAEKAFHEWALEKSQSIVAAVSHDNPLNSTEGHHAVLVAIYAGRGVALSMLQPLADAKDIDWLKTSLKTALSDSAHYERQRDAARAEIRNLWGLLLSALAWSPAVELIKPVVEAFESASQFLAQHARPAADDGGITHPTQSAKENAP